MMQIGKHFQTKMVFDFLLQMDPVWSGKWIWVHGVSPWKSLPVKQWMFYI